MAGRPAELAGAAETVGLLMNAVPIRAEIRPDVKVIDWLTDLQAQLSESVEHQFTPAAQAARWAGVAQGAPLFESAVFFENYPVDGALKQGVAGLRVTGIEFSEQHHYPLSLIAVPGDELLLQIHYHRSRFAPGDIDGMAMRMVALLEAMTADPAQTLDELLSGVPVADHFSAAAGND
jgi:non-ribosomal peptide synthetase component F